LKTLETKREEGVMRKDSGALQASDWSRFVLK
jgi:hypothetical protein